MNPPFIVTGTGRSGTSVVARCLSELGVDMGESIPADHTNPEGFFEDAHVLKCNSLWLNSQYGFPDLRRDLLPYFAERSKAPLWGFKDPRIANTWHVLIDLVPFERVIVCQRPKLMVVKSLKRCYGWPEGMCEKFYEVRRGRLEHLCRSRRANVVVLEMGERRSLDEIKEEILEHFPVLSPSTSASSVSDKSQPTSPSGCSPSPSEANTAS